MQDSSRELILLTGLSGSGKSTCLGLLEDIGYICVDNIPPKLLIDIISLFEHMETKKMALVVDARWKQDMQKTVERIGEYFNTHNDIKKMIIFLESKEDIIAKRYALTRRKHPLQESNDISDAINKEKELLSPIREIADSIIDTSNFNTHELREHLKKTVERNLSIKTKAVPLRFVSFGYKYGLPLDSDFIIDCRFLPNPFWDKKLSKFSGLDKEIEDFFKNFSIVDNYIQSIIFMLEIAVKKYEEEGKGSMSICIGCSGGRHRSVYIAEKIHNFFKEREHNCFIEHRDMEKHSI